MHWITLIFSIVYNETGDGRTEDNELPQRAVEKVSSSMTNLTIAQRAVLAEKEKTDKYLKGRKLGRLWL